MSASMISKKENKCTIFVIKESIETFTQIWANSILQGSIKVYSGDEMKKVADIE